MTDEIEPHTLFLMFLAATGGEQKVALDSYVNADITNKGIRVKVEDDVVVFTLEDDNEL